MRDQRVKEHSCLRNDFGSNSRTFSETNNIVIPSFVKLLCLLSFEVCFCRDILPSFCLVRLFTSASNGIRLKTFFMSCFMFFFHVFIRSSNIWPSYILNRLLKTLLVSRIRILIFCPLFNFLYVLTRAFKLALDKSQQSFQREVFARVKWTKWGLALPN